MDQLLDKAREAGMAVLLDACIGRERFHSIVGSQVTLERFANLCKPAYANREVLSRWADLCEHGSGLAVAAAIRDVLTVQD